MKGLVGKKNYYKMKLYKTIWCLWNGYEYCFCKNWKNITILKCERYDIAAILHWQQFVTFSRQKLYLLVPAIDQLVKAKMKGLASYCKAETTFTFYFSFLTLSSAFLSIDNIEMKSESGFSFAMASQPFRFGSYIFNKIFFKYAEILNIQICCLLLDQIFQ